jgi:hypothetical protein
MAITKEKFLEITRLGNKFLVEEEAFVNQTASQQEAEEMMSTLTKEEAIEVEKFKRGLILKSIEILKGNGFQIIPPKQMLCDCENCKAARERGEAPPNADQIIQAIKDIVGDKAEVIAISAKDLMGNLGS